MSNSSKEHGARAYTVTQTWEHKRRKALERVFEFGISSEDPEILNTALDALTVSHIAARFELDRGPPTDWEGRAARALVRVVSILEKSAGMDEDPEAEEALNLALDELAIARAAAAFEMLRGPINWKKRSLRQFARRNRTAGFFTHANTL